MLCGILIKLLFSGLEPELTPMQEIELAIDIEAEEMFIGEQRTIEGLDDSTRRGLLELLNRNPRIRAVSIGDAIVMRKFRR